MTAKGLPHLAALVLTATVLTARAADPPPETLETDGGPVNGQVEGDARSGFVFKPAGNGPARPLEVGAVVRGPGRGPGPAAGTPPFRVDLGMGQKITGRLGALDGGQLVLPDATGTGSVRVARSALQSLVQRPGETLVTADGFETLDTTRWTVVGEPVVEPLPRLSGEKSLRLSTDGTALTHRLARPFGAGRLEVAFHDTAKVVEGQKWFVDLTFQSQGGPQTVRAVLGWSEESLAVESLGGPALAVQRLSRSPGWHRLAIRFGPDRCEVSVDGNELAHGKGFDGLLMDVRLGTSTVGRDDPDARPVGYLDDFRLIRSTEPVGQPEIDTTQDEVRLTTGDQVFGEVKAADPERVTVTVDGRSTSFSWGEVAGLYFRRESSPGVPLNGLLVRAEWRSAPGTDARDIDSIEGELRSVSPASLQLSTSHAGTLTVPRERIVSLTVIGRGNRLVIDTSAHHLGDEISTQPPLLDPPQPEGGVLERVFELDRVPDGPTRLVLDVISVVGEEAEHRFSALVKRGEIRTNVACNGNPFDYLNRYITSKNETVERVRIPLPKGALRRGRNVVRFEQVGEAGNPNSLDDLGIVGIALEW